MKRRKKNQQNFSYLCAAERLLLIFRLLAFVLHSLWVCDLICLANSESSHHPYISIANMHTHFLQHNYFTICSFFFFFFACVCVYGDSCCCCCCFRMMFPFSKYYSVQSKCCSFEIIVGCLLAYFLTTIFSLFRVFIGFDVDVSWTDIILRFLPFTNYVFFCMPDVQWYFWGAFLWCVLCKLSSLLSKVRRKSQLFFKSWYGNRFVWSLVVCLQICINYKFDAKIKCHKFVYVCVRHYPKLKNKHWI